MKNSIILRDRPVYLKGEDMEVFLENFFVWHMDRKKIFWKHYMAEKEKKYFDSEKNIAPSF